VISEETVALAREFSKAREKPLEQTRIATRHGLNIDVRHEKAS
jgi:hypothetical protein